MIGCLRTRVRNQPIIALYFEFTTSGPGISSESLRLFTQKVFKKRIQNKNHKESQPFQTKFKIELVWLLKTKQKLLNQRFQSMFSLYPLSILVSYVLVRYKIFL